MQARTALLAAITCGALAVAIVAADVAWSLEARIESQGANGWETVASGPFADARPYAYPLGAACAGPDLRLIVHNDRPVAASGVHVQVFYWNTTSGRNVVVLDERWSLDAFAERTHTFRIPDSAFPAGNNTSTPDKRLDPYGEPGVSVQAQVDGIFLSVMVCKEVAA